VNQYYVDKTKQLENDFINARKNGEDTGDIRQEWLAMQRSKQAMREHFNDVNGALKSQPLSTLLQAPRNAQKRERMGQKEMPAGD
jgi:hypothetical protein